MAAWGPRGKRGPLICWVSSGPAERGLPAGGGACGCLSHSSPGDYPKLCLQDLASAFQQEAQASGKQRLLLSAAVASGRDVVDTGYEVDKLAV